MNEWRQRLDQKFPLPQICPAQKIIFMPLCSYCVVHPPEPCAIAVLSHWQWHKSSLPEKKQPCPRFPGSWESEPVFELVLLAPGSHPAELCVCLSQCQRQRSHSKRTASAGSVAGHTFQQQISGFPALASKKRPLHCGGALPWKGHFAARAPQSLSTWRCSYLEDERLPDCPGRPFCVGCWAWGWEGEHLWLTLPQLSPVSSLHAATLDVQGRKSPM